MKARPTGLNAEHQHRAAAVKKLAHHIPALLQCQASVGCVTGSHHDPRGVRRSWAVTVAVT
eukprot:1851060-Prymnesium_polylepis.1